MKTCCLGLVGLCLLLAGCQPAVQAQPTDAPVSTATQSSTPSAVPLAFPGAEGFGANSLGGRGGKVIEVTNLEDSGPGSLRAAIEAEGPRLVVFRTAGMIEVKTALEITHPYITIAGQTAPGDGITLKNAPENPDGPLIVNTHDVILRHLRSRPGPPAGPSENGDAIEILGDAAYNVIVDHCSFSWAIDEVASIWYAARNITLQWSIIAEGLHCSQHTKGCHSMGLIVGSTGAKDISIHHNLLVSNHERNPLVETSGVVDVVNNVLYNSWGSPALASDEYGPVSVNYVANYMLFGPDSDPSKSMVSVQNEAGNGVQVYVAGNLTPRRPSDDLDQALAVKPASREWIVSGRFPAASITTQTARQAYEQVLAEAGASLRLDEQGAVIPRRDAVDQRLVTQVKEGGGKIIDDPAQVGGWPALAAGVPYLDVDHDGMPDAWEQRYSFDPQDASDGPADADGDGYTNVEEFLNGSNPLK